ncbi:MAG TPA: trypsin-like peptidase domain-containing protein [Streptosporangiaceae bacterium]|jgi:S1-C subfamily serine protease
MSTSYDPPTRPDPGQSSPPPSPPPWPGQGSAGGYGNPSGATYPPPPPPPPGYPGYQGQSYQGQSYPGQGYQGQGYQGQGYQGQGYQGQGYPGQGYQGQGGYPGGQGYPTGAGYPGYPGYQGGPGYPGGPDYLIGPGGPGGQGQKRRPSRLRRSLAVAAVAAVVGAGTAFAGLHSSNGSSGSNVLTTAQVADRVDPALVDINTTLGYEQAEAAGTGLVLTSDGEILTNNHVIEGSTSITATDIGNGHTYKARVVGYDRSHDIAVIKLVNASGLQTVTLGNSGSAATGQKVVALGNAGGKGGRPSVVAGHITGLNAAITASDASAGTSEKLTGLIRHNAAIQPGDSGGPLANTTGDVIAINTAASSHDFQFSGTQSTQGFAIPINQATSIAKQINAGQASKTVHIGATGFVGVEVTSAGQSKAQGVPAGAGALIAGVISGSPAQQAGLVAGDVITSVNGQHVGSALTLQGVLQGHHPGDSVQVSWKTQSGQTHTGTIQLTTGPAG